MTDQKSPKESKCLANKTGNPLYSNVQVDREVSRKVCKFLLRLGPSFASKSPPGAGDTPVTESESVSESSGREETERRVD